MLGHEMCRKSSIKRSLLFIYSVPYKYLIGDGLSVTEQTRTATARMLLLPWAIHTRSTPVTIAEYNPPPASGSCSAQNGTPHWHIPGAYSSDGMPRRGFRRSATPSLTLSRKQGREGWGCRLGGVGRLV